MARTTSPFLLSLLACLGACATAGLPSKSGWGAPTYTGSLPTPEASADEGRAPDETSLPIGVGITTGPSTFLVGGTLDFPLDKKMTVGPSLQYGIGDDVDLLSLTGQLKYFLGDADGGKDSPTFLPYVTVGVGVASIDKEGRSGDSGLVINGGAGVRFLTGENYRIGSEARVSLLPDELGGEHAFLSLELLQIVVSF